MRVVYCATRNLYPHLNVAINSLRRWHPCIDVACILQDDYQIDGADILNEKEYLQYFDLENAHANTKFTYMSLMRLALPKIIDDDKVLYLDVDTIVNADITELLELEMGDNLVAGVPEHDEYLNAGVLLMNLKAMRESGADDELLRTINGSEFFLYPDQDAMNKVCAGKKILLPAEYNEMFATQISEQPKIVHYAGENEWWKPGHPRNIYYYINNGYKYGE